jgi:exopolyphosphatase / guanosine-5'-triphosphate,3'-diphosphate pyrophosphatase
LKKFVAAVDMGTNSFHLVIAEVFPNGGFHIIAREREVIRLASQKGEDLNHISEDETERAVGILSRFKNLAEKYNTSLRAVATSAVREADNKNEFIAAVKDRTGILVEAIEGRSEARLIFRGASKSLGLIEKNVLHIDIGGGSTELIFAEKGKIIFAESIKIGAVRLSRKFFPDYNVTEERARRCTLYIEERIKENPNISCKINFDTASGSSGTIVSAAEMINYSNTGKPVKNINGFTFTKNELDELLAMILSKRTSEVRQSIEGLEFKRADIIPAGLIILHAIFRLFEISELIISGFALREGIILDSIANNLPNTPVS